ncbi:kinase-like domain-containing protein [Rhizophagus irregularis DAOM 181602=DAOM 197198]|nr:kinase-like domain-containing protein [Rhizophagus irregularis DAOM 181602=DAOM 197198]
MSYNWNNWIEEAILNEHINCYEYKDFYNLEGIGTGGFGKVYRANWKNSHNIYALKSLKDSEAKKFVDELKIQRKVNVHDNIIRFYGITRVDQNYSSKIYMLVIEYADGGLRETPIQDTPKDYEKIYTDCWEFEPDDRPTIYNVVDRLEAISSKTTKSWNSSPSSRNNSSPSSRNNSSPSSRNYSSLSSRDNLSQSFKQKESKDIVDGIAALPSKIYDKRKKQKILDYLEDHHVTSKEILDWLENNQNYPNSLLVLGDFHYLGIATEVDKKMACNFYEKAGDGDDGLSVAQYNLGVIYETDKLDDTIAALYWYNKSAEQGNHEAWESFNRLRCSSGTKTVSPSSMQKYGSMGIFNR